MEVSFSAFADEFVKIADLGNLWQRFVRVFRPEDGKTQRRIDYQFSPKAGRDKWDKLVRNSRDQGFVDALSKHPQADEKLKQHAQAMHDLSRGQTVAKIQSGTSAGKSYEVRETGAGLACTCPDWRYTGSVNPGYECKHIRAHKLGNVKAN